MVNENPSYLSRADCLPGVEFYFSHGPARLIDQLKPVFPIPESLTRLFESFHSMNLGQLIADQQGVELAGSFWARFLHMFLGYLVQAGLSDEEDEFDESWSGGSSEFLCDTCRYNDIRDCHRAERPNAVVCDDYSRR